MALGLEEWISGSENWLTTVRCVKPKGLVVDKRLVELYSHFYRHSSDQVFIERGKSIEFVSGQVIHIPLNAFESFIARKGATNLPEYAQQKLKYLRDRVSFL